WEEIPSQIVIKSFLKCGISNADDSSQDHFLYESDESDEEQKREEVVVHLDNESATEIEFNNNEDNEDE
ncbi:9249_t:CDS:1, partial [Acaulospora morrowiae]